MLPIRHLVHDYMRIEAAYVTIREIIYTSTIAFFIMAYTSGIIGFEIYKEMINRFKMHVLYITKKVHLLIVLFKVEIICFHNLISLKISCPDLLQTRASKGNKKGNLRMYKGKTFQRFQKINQSFCQILKKD